MMVRNLPLLSLPLLSDWVPNTVCFLENQARVKLSLCEVLHHLIQMCFFGPERVANSFQPATFFLTVYFRFPFPDIDFREPRAGRHWVKDISQSTLPSSCSHSMRNHEDLINVIFGLVSWILNSFILFKKTSDSELITDKQKSAQDLVSSQFKFNMAAVF